MNRIILAILLSFSMLNIACKKDKDDDDKEVVNYKVKSDGYYTYAYNANGLLALRTEPGPDSFKTYYEWRPDSLIVVETRYLPHQRTGYARDAAGYVLSERWVYDAAHNIVLSYEPGSSTKYTWLDGNCIRKEYPGLMDGFEYSTELNTLDFGLKYFPYELLPSKNLCVKASLTYSQDVITYVKDAKGRIIEKSTISVENNNQVRNYKTLYTYFD